MGDTAKAPDKKKRSRSYKGEGEKSLKAHPQVEEIGKDNILDSIDKNENEYNVICDEFMMKDKELAESKNIQQNNSEQTYYNTHRIDIEEERSETKGKQPLTASSNKRRGKKGKRTQRGRAAIVRESHKALVSTANGEKGEGGGETRHPRLGGEEEDLEGYESEGRSVHGGEQEEQESEEAFGEDITMETWQAYSFCYDRRGGDEKRDRGGGTRKGEKGPTMDPNPDSDSETEDEENDLPPLQEDSDGGWSDEEEEPPQSWGDDGNRLEGGGSSPTLMPDTPGTREEEEERDTDIKTQLAMHTVQGVSGLREGGTSDLPFTVQEGLHVLSVNHRRARSRDTPEEKELEVAVNWQEEDESDSEESITDYEDNLTYMEDSLSVIKGAISTGLGRDMTVWIVTDTGSMTQLIQAEYAKKMKLQTFLLPESKRFNIQGPGGGTDNVTRAVKMKVTIQMQQVEEGSDPSGENEGEVITKRLLLTFGIVESLPVPILWGGHQMRMMKTLDLHHVRKVAVNLRDGRQYITNSTSWTQALEEMEKIEGGEQRKAIQGFLPTKTRMANMAMGSRKASNVAGVLAPLGNNIVRISRHGSKEDEGANSVTLTNREEIETRYGGLITVIDAVTQGESFIIVRNNTNSAINLPGHTIEVAISPTVTLPTGPTTSSNILQTGEGWEAAVEVRREATREKDERYAESEEEATLRYAERQWMKNPLSVGNTVATYLERRSPRSHYTWKCGDLTRTIKEKGLDEFYKHIMQYQPDMITLLGVKWRNHGGDASEPNKEGPERTLLNNLMIPLEGKYKYHCNLSQSGKAGQIVLLRWDLPTPIIGRNVGTEEGRVTTWHFPDQVVVTVDAPFSGGGEEHLLQRRAVFNTLLKRELTRLGENPTHIPRVVVGNFSAVLTDRHVKGNKHTWANQRRDLELPEERGSGSTCQADRESIRQVAEDLGLGDAALHREGTKQQYSIQGTGKNSNYGLCWDYAFIENTILKSGGVRSNTIIDLKKRCIKAGEKGKLEKVHNPMWLSLKEGWWERATEHHKKSEEERNGQQGVRIAAHTKTEPIEQEGEKIRPDLFPEKLWDLVDEEQKGYVDQRFKKFKKREYLEECVQKILTVLDIHDTGVYHKPRWKKKGDEAKEDDILRAQALANIDVYFFKDPGSVDMAKGVIAEINTTDERPTRCKPRKMSVVQQAFLQAKTTQMERVGKIEESTSQWCHGLVLVAYEERIKAFMDKRGESAMEDMFLPEHEDEVATFFRLCVDLRTLNAKTIPDIFPLPRIDDLIESIPRGCGRYSLSDVCDAFFTVELLEKHRAKTAFKTHDRHLQFAVLPQGWINSPSVFCRLIARTFSGMERSKFSAYIDDVLNHTNDMDDHLETQQETYERLRQNKLTLKVTKTHLNQVRVKFLGHILTKEGRLPDPKSVAAIQEWKDPSTTREVRSFLGATLYYREYIYDYSDMAMPLYDLIRKGVIVEKEWDPAIHGRAVQRIKDALTSKPVLMSVDNTKKFRLKVDACRVGRGIGCILEQENSEGKWQPVSYYSSSLNKSERQYSATELECKALHDCIIHYAIYLKYIPHFEVFSDHNALKYMVKADNSTTNGRLMRYLLGLQSYNFSLYYRKGTQNADADAVSRLLRISDEPIYLTEEQLRDESGIVTKAILDRAKKMDARNKASEKEAQKILRKMQRRELVEMAELNDRILEEGIENLETETGRQRFFENIQKKGMGVTRETLEETVAEMAHTGAAEEGATEAELVKGGESDPQMVNFIMCVATVSPYEAEESEAQSPKGLGERVGTRGKEWEVNHCFDEGEGGLRSLLAHLVQRHKEGEEHTGREIYDMEGLRGRRAEVVENYGKMVLANTAEGRGRQPRTSSRLAQLDRCNYLEEAKTQPNIFDQKDKPAASQINVELVKKRKEGYNRCEVRESLLGEGTGRGLFLTRDIKTKGEVICTYEGAHISPELVGEGGKGRDYVAAVIMDTKSKVVSYIDSVEEDSCYGRYANDPIDELLVNAKLIWRNGKVVLVATDAMKKGDEVYLNYGIEYWEYRMSILTQELRERIRREYPGQKKVQFQDTVIRGTYDNEKTAKSAKEKIQVAENGEALHKAAPNRQTRIHRTRVDLEEEKTEETTVVQESEMIDDEELGVEECKQLAEEMRPLLEQKKFIDDENGRLYKIYQVRYDEEYEMVIGFRSPLTGRTDRQDGSAFRVFGKSGLWDLVQQYAANNPEEEEHVEWPRDSGEWALRQGEDPKCKEIISEIEKSGGPLLMIEKGKFGLVNSTHEEVKMLIRKANTPTGEVEQSVVPESLKRKAMEVHHEEYGHTGADRMYETMKLRYYWQAMGRDIRAHVGKCVNCKLRKTYQRRPRVPIMKYDSTKRPLDRVHIDLTGPLRTTKGGHKYIMVIKDFLTKYVWLIPLGSKTAEEVAENFVSKFVCQAGVPERLVSDRGNEFVNKILKAVSRVMGINRISTTAYNPQANGFVENHNKTLKDQLYHFVDTLRQDDWDIYLPVTQLMYNTTVSSATGFTPMLLMTGREAKMPSMNHMSKEDIGVKKELMNNNYVSKMIAHMRACQDLSITRAGENQERYNVREQKPLEFVEYVIGQRFMRKRRPISVFNSADDKEAWKLSMKLLERFEGPYTISAKISPVLYESEIDGETTRVHAVNMKPY